MKFQKKKKKIPFVIEIKNKINLTKYLNLTKYVKDLHTENYEALLKETEKTQNIIERYYVFMD